MNWQSYIPEDLVSYIENKIHGESVLIKISKSRRSKFGDYLNHPYKGHVITVNKDLGKYAFFFTLCHELAHYFAFKQYGSRIKPHGKEWKQVFRQIMLPVCQREVFPPKLNALIMRHMNKPKASSAIDIDLKKELSVYSNNDISKVPIMLLDDLKKGQDFMLRNGRKFKLIEKKRTRAHCLEIKGKRIYSIHKATEVSLLPCLQSFQNQKSQETLL